MLRSIVSDPVLLTLLVGGSGLLVSRWRPRSGALVVLAALLGLYALSTSFVATRLLAAVEPEPTPWAGTRGLKPQAIVVLGGGARSAPDPQDESVNGETLERVRHAARLWRETQLPVLVAGGVTSGATQSEAALMARTLREDFGVPVAWEEGRSRTTYENAKYSAQLLEPSGTRTIYLVTHAWHMRRALDIFERSGFQAVAAPVGFTLRDPADGPESLVPRVFFLADSGRALRELIGGLIYQVIYPPQPVDTGARRPQPTASADPQPLTTSPR